MSIPINLRRPREPFPSVPGSGAAQMPLGSVSTDVQRQLLWEGTCDQVTWVKEPFVRPQRRRSQLLKYKIQNYMGQNSNNGDDESTQPCLLRLKPAPDRNTSSLYSQAIALQLPLQPKAALFCAASRFALSG